MSRKGILVFIFFIVATMLVPACGGGGSDSSSSNDGPPPPKVIYAAEGGNQTGGVWNFYSIDPATGVATLISPIGVGIGFGVTGMDFGPGGVLYGTTSDGGANPFSLITINTATGLGTFVGQTNDAVSVNHPFRDIAFVGPLLYGMTGGTIPCQLRNIAIADGSVGLSIGLGKPVCGPGGGKGDGIAADNGSTTVYHSMNSLLDLYTVDVVTGAFVSVVTLNGGVLGTPITAATFHEGTLFIVEADSGAGGNRQLMTVNTANGVMTAVGLTLTSSWISAIASRDR